MQPDNPREPPPPKRPRREIEPCDDPVCSCEPEPRWLRFENEKDISEWEALERPPREEF